MRFHLALLAASGSESIFLVVHAVRESLARHLPVVLRALPAQRKMLNRLTREHVEILAAVRAGDGATAAALMERHIGGFYRGMASDGPC